MARIRRSQAESLGKIMKTKHLYHTLMVRSTANNQFLPLKFHSFLVIQSISFFFFCVSLKLFCSIILKKLSRWLTNQSSIAVFGECVWAQVDAHLDCCCCCGAKRLSLLLLIFAQPTKLKIYYYYYFSRCSIRGWSCWEVEINQRSINDADM